MAPRYLVYILCLSASQCFGTISVLGANSAKEPAATASVDGSVDALSTLDQSHHDPKLSASKIHSKTKFATETKTESTTQPEADTRMLPQTEALSAKGLFGYGIEGPAVDARGALYAVNFKENGTIGQLKPGRAPTLWLTFPNGQIGTALRILNAQEMLMTERRKHQLVKINLETRKIEVLAQNNDLNQPNDLCISKTGSVFVSDPSWSRKKRGGIWLWEKGKGLRALMLDLKAVNGIALSSDETTLYYSESIGGGLWALDWNGKELKNKRLLHQFEADSVDGLRVNEKGEILLARITKGRIDRVSATGELLSSTILRGKDPTNLAFGGSDGKTVYVSQRDGRFIESFTTDSPGLEFLQLHPAPARAEMAK